MKKCPAFAGDRGNLPANVSALVGRGDDVARVKRLLSSSRLVTLTGVGGVGKTALALRAATEFQRAFDGAWLVELAGIAEPSLVPWAVAAAVGVPGGRPGSPPPGAGELAEYLAGRRVLLVLDGCEHLLNGCATLAGGLLRSVPGLRILATSRRSLSIDGEVIFTVPPLPAPDPEHPPPNPEALERYPSAALFAQRAAAASPGFRLRDDDVVPVTRLCHRLDGIPLAIELAARRARTLPLGELADRPDDDPYASAGEGNRMTPPRRRSLPALLGRSYDLLSPAERAMWARLSVFEGPFDLDVAESVCAGGGVAPGDVVDLLDRLVDGSVLLREERDGRARYRMLGSLRRYGRGRPAGVPDLARRHRDYYLGLAERAAREWFGPDQVRWSERLGLERSDLDAALDGCLAGPAGLEAGVRLAVALHRPYWLAGSRYAEGRRRLARLLAALPGTCPARADALYVAALLALMQGDRASAGAMAAEFRERTRPGDPTSAARAARLAALDALYACAPDAAAGDPLPVAAGRDRPVDAALAVRLCREAHEAYAALEDPFGAAMSAWTLATALASGDEDDRAVSLCERHLAAARRQGESWCRAHGLVTLATVRSRHDSGRQAAAQAREALGILRAFGDRAGMALAVETLAWTACDGDPTRSALLLGAADGVARAAGVPVLRAGWHAGRHRRCAASLRRRLGGDRFARAFARGASLTLDEAVRAAGGDTPSRPPSGPPQGLGTAAGTGAPAAAGTAVEGSPLTRREMEVAELVAGGLSNKQIAAALVIAQRTAEGHVGHIMGKLGFGSRAQIAAWAAARRRRAPAR